MNKKAKFPKRWTTRKPLPSPAAENLYVEISHTQHKNGRTDMTARIADENGNWLKEYPKKEKRGSKGSKEVASDENVLAARLAGEWEKINVPDVAKLEGDHIYTDAFLSIPEEERRTLCPISWQSKHSVRQGLAGFYRVLELLDEMGDSVDENDMVQLEQKLAEQAASHGNALGDPEFSRQGNVRRTLANFIRMYPLLRLRCPGLPDIPMPILRGTSKKVGVERCKALPMPNLVLLYQLLLREAAKTPRALGVALMLLSGCRTGEACAVKFDSIEIKVVGRLMYGAYAIEYTADGNVRSVRAKTDKSYRLIIMPMEMVILVNLRIQELKDQGYTEGEIQDMYLVSLEEDPYVMESVGRVSAYGRELLLRVGVTSDYWDAVRRAMWIDHDLDAFRKPEKDPTAYALRRAAITIWTNICGMDPDLADVLVGHTVRGDGGRLRKYVSRPDSWPVIAEQMSHMVYDPAHTGNPAFCPIVLGPDENYRSQMPYGSFLLQAEENGEYEIQAECSELLDHLIAEVPAGRRVRIEPYYQMRMKGEYRQPIGKTYPAEWYSGVLREAEDNKENKGEDGNGGK